MIISVIIVVVVSLLMALLWEKGFEATAIVLEKVHIPEHTNSMAEYDAYITGDDTLLFSYYPEKWKLLLDYRGNRYSVQVGKDEYSRISEEDAVTIFCRQNMVFRYVRVISVVS